MANVFKQLNINYTFISTELQEHYPCNVEKTKNKKQKPLNGRFCHCMIYHYEATDCKIAGTVLEIL